MNYDLETVDYIFDAFSFTLFQMDLDPNSTPMDRWDDSLIPFQFSEQQFAEWLKSNWSVVLEQFETEEMSSNPNYNWTLAVDFYRGIPEKSKILPIEGSYTANRSIIYFKSQSLFLFEFIQKLTRNFGMDRMFVSVGADLHIVEFNQKTSKLDFLREIHSHHTRVGRE